MPTLPTLASGSVARYPVTVSKFFPTDVVQFVSDKEQRWANKSSYSEFILAYVDANSYDLNVMLEFYLSKKGSFVDSSLSNTFTMVFDGVTYNYCYFVNDELIQTEHKPNRYTFELHIRQARSN